MQTNNLLPLLIPASLLASVALAIGPLWRLPLARSVGRGLVGFSCVLLASTLVLVACSSLALASDEAVAKPATTPAGASELNTPIADEPTVIIPPGRPAWVEGKPFLADQIQKVPVGSGPYSRLSDAQQALDVRLEAKVQEFIADHLHSRFAAQFVTYDLSTIKSRLIRSGGEYREQITVSIGPMHQFHSLLEFSPDFQREIEHRWDHVRANSRLIQVALIGGALLLLLLTVCGYFRLDNATRGFYTSRLQFATAAAILAIVGSGAVAARWIHWL